MPSTKHQKDLKDLRVAFPPRDPGYAEWATHVLDAVVATHPAIVGAAFFHRPQVITLPNPAVGLQLAAVGPPAGTAWRVLSVFLHLATGAGGGNTRVCSLRVDRGPIPQTVTAHFAGNNFNINSGVNVTWAVMGSNFLAGPNVANQQEMIPIPDLTLLPGDTLNPIVITLDPTDAITLANVVVQTLEITP